MGAFVEEIAELRLFNTEWKVVTQIDLNFFSLELQNIKKVTIHLQKKCRLFNQFLNSTIDTDNWYQFHCTIPQANMDILMREIDENSHLWFIDHNESHSRPKRSVFSVLGGVLLGAAGFGFLSDNIAEFYMEEFQKLHQMNKKQNIYNQKQTILIESIFHQLDSTENKIYNMTQQINNAFTEMESYVLNAKKEFHTSNKHIHLLPIQADIITLMDNFILLMMRFLFKQKQFLEAVAIPHKNPSNPNLIPPQTLYNALDEPKNSISDKGLELPIPLSRNTLSQFYKLATSETAIINNTILITFSFPLLSANHYTLFKTTSLPYRVKDNLFAYIIPNHEYVALDHFKEKYVAITENEIGQCFQTNSNGQK